jgi:mannosyltransferase OCH1-like enzyme
MKQNFEKLIHDNPEFEVNLFDNNDCQEFIKNNFPEIVLNTYNKLIPESYKSDLWRYCVMYINGGIYLDIKFKCINGFKLIALTEKEMWTSDHSYRNTLTGLLVLKEKNEIMLKCIYDIVENVKNKFYGNTDLCPTGPGLLGKYFTHKQKLEMETNLLVISPQVIGITYKNIFILKYYNEYRNEQEKQSPKLHYSILWNNRNIYL